jgi:tetratricopeptide (TPR) repeat protein
MAGARRGRAGGLVMQGFSEYARYLQHPLTLIGFVLLLAFGVHRALLRSGIIPPLSAGGGSRVVQSLLRYGFVIALATIVLGFGLQFFETSRTKATPREIAKLTTETNNEYLRAQHQKDYAWFTNVTEEERQRATTSSRELEDLLTKAGIKLSPQSLTGLAYAHLIANELEKAKTEALDAIHADPSLGEAYQVLAIVAQIQSNEAMQKGDLAHAHAALDVAEMSAKGAREYIVSNSAVGNQLGFIYKDMAQLEMDSDRAKAAADLAQAQELFQAGLGVHPDDPGPHNGLGSVYYLGGNVDGAIEEQIKAVSLMPTYTFAWHDLAIDLAAKYRDGKPPDPRVLWKLNKALDALFKLQAAEGTQKLPPEHLTAMRQLQAWALSEAEKFPPPKRS